MDDDTSGLWRRMHHRGISYEIKIVGSCTYDIRITILTGLRRRLCTFRLETGTLGFPSRPPAVFVWDCEGSQWIPYERFLGTFAKTSFFHVMRWQRTGGNMLFWESPYIVLSRCLVSEVVSEMTRKRRQFEKYMCRQYIRDLPEDIVVEVCQFL